MAKAVLEEHAENRKVDMIVVDNEDTKRVGRWKRSGRSCIVDSKGSGGGRCGRDERHTRTRILKRLAPQMGVRRQKHRRRGAGEVGEPDRLCCTKVC